MADTRVTLRWEGQGLVFQAAAEGGPDLVVDGDGRAGISPVQQLAVALGGCMGADIIDIMNKSRAPLGALAVLVEADRAPQPPRRFTRVHMRFTVTGVAESDAGKLERALELSRSTYCSVLHTLRPDAEVTFALERH